MVAAVRSEKVVLVCHVLPFLEYSQPATLFKVTLVAVKLDTVGADGAVCEPLDDP